MVCGEREKQQETIFLPPLGLCRILYPIPFIHYEDSSSPEPSWLAIQPSFYYSLSLRSVSLKMGYMRSGQEIFHRQWP